MKKYLLTTLAFTVFSTSSVLGSMKTTDRTLYDFLTINGKPIKYIFEENMFNKNDCITENTTQNTTEITTTENTTEVTTTDNATEVTTSDNTTETTTQNNNILEIEMEVVELVNIEREKNGLNPLKVDSNLCKVARLKSEDMKNKGYFSHTSPTYGSPFDMLKQFNISYKSAGENIAKGQTTAQQVVNAWMNSEGHRANILSSSYTHIGVGFSSNHWTQLFISK